MSILLTGGSGGLGREIGKICECKAPSHEEFDITSKKSIRDWMMCNWPIHLIIHCAAYTNVVSAEREKDKCYNVNVVGTANLADLHIPMIYISTEYVFDGERGNYSEESAPNPVNYYALTKLLGEFEAKRTESLVIRTLLKHRPFPHPAALVDQFTSGDYVDVIAREIVLAARAFEKNHNVFIPRIINIGTDRKSTFDLAKQTRDVTPTTLDNIRVKLPRDTSLNITKWREFKGSL